MTNNKIDEVDIRILNKYINLPLHSKRMADDHRFKMFMINEVNDDYIVVSYPCGLTEFIKPSASLSIISGDLWLLDTDYHSPQISVEDEDVWEWHKIK
jgi:hypothetical protein